MKALGYILYEGPSEIDGAPIVVIMTGLSGSKNDKTGNMLQTYILRSDVHPLDALKSGQDRSICGDCEHRPILAKVTGEPPCYVEVGKGASMVWKAYKAGRYARLPLYVIARLIAARVLRLGTYGDPAAAPIRIWQAIVVYVAGWTGYSHQWRRLGIDWQMLVMASVDSESDRLDAKSAGWRTFRVSVGIDKQSGEASCPASAEAGRRSKCIKCQLCSGTQIAAKDVVIADHALGHKRRVIAINALQEA